MPVHTSSYKGGMDRDSSKNKYQPDSYYKMRNMRLTSFDELSSGAVQSIKGNVIAIEQPLGYSDDVIIGWCVIRNYLVVWSTADTTEAGGRGTIFYTDLSVSSPSWTIVCQFDDMNLTIQYPIFDEAIGYYEAEDIIKIYWTDNHNMYRFVNIFDPPATVDQLDILHEITIRQPTIRDIGGGHIYAGMVQYAYQYYNIGGIETVFSPCTPLVHLTKSSEGLPAALSMTYEGTTALDSAGNPNESGKSVVIEIEDLDENYDKIRIVAILYRNLDQEPEIHVVGEYDVIDSIIVLDSGVYNKGTLTLNAFRTLGNHELYCKTISQKGNKAVIGNITEKFFDIDFDARAYRYGPIASLGVLSGSEDLHITSLTDMDLTSCSNTSMYFDFTTPFFVSIKNGDTMTGTYTFNHLRIDYMEDALAASGTGTAHDTDTIPVEGWDVGFIYMDDSNVKIKIENFRAFAIAELGLDPAISMTDVPSIVAVVHIVGNYNTFIGPTPFEDIAGIGTILTYSEALDTIDINVQSSGAPFFTGFLSFVEADCLAHFAVNYNYDVLHVYETYDTADVTFVPEAMLPDPDPANWTFRINKNVGNWFTLSTAFDHTCIIAIDLSISVDYTYDSYDKRIIVYNSVLNIEEEIEFDVDTPGCAWPNTTYLLDGSLVPEDHDCINPYNYDFLYGHGLDPQIDEVSTYCDITDFLVNAETGEANNANQFKYQSDMVTLGGEGPNVMYEFIMEDMDVDISTSSRYDSPDTVYIDNITSYDSYKNPLRTAYFLSNKRDEVYRYGIVFTNTRGQESFVKWIGDIKFPTMKERQLMTNVGRTATAHALGIKFTVNTTPLVAEGVVGMKIVRVKREKSDRTIYSQGAIGAMFNDTTPGLDRISAFPRMVLETPYVGYGNTYAIMKSVIQFVSPEVNYFKDLSPNADDYIKVAAKLGHNDSRYTYASYDPADPLKTMDDVGALNEQTLLTQVIYEANYILNVSKYLATDDVTDLVSYPILEGVLAGIVEKYGEDENLISMPILGANVVNRAYDYLIGTSTIMHEGPSGTCAILCLNRDVVTTELTWGTEYYEILLVDYKIHGAGATQYGGLSYQARQVNEYIECGPYTEVPAIGGDVEMEVYGGDTYIGLYEHLKTMWEADDNDGDGDYDVVPASRYFANVMFPCESVINFDIGHGTEYSKYYAVDNSFAIREDEETYHADTTNTAIPVAPAVPEIFIQDRNMYMYNSVYSQQNITKVYFQRPDNWLEEVHDDTLVKISLEKYIREEVDSYIKFLTDNQKILPTEFGPINDLFLFKNYMLVFFDNAIGSLSIDERALLPIQNNSILELGAANNLQHFDYISNKSGSVHPQSIDYCGDGFIWFDAYNGMVGYYNGNTQDIGLVKGMSSPFMQHTELLKKIEGGFKCNQFAGGNVLCYENRKYKETLFAIVYSEYAYLNAAVDLTATSVTFSIDNSPGHYNDACVIVNGEEYIAERITHTSHGYGLIEINNTDNPSLNLSPAKWYTGYYFIYYKDLSKTYSFSNVTDAFMFEVDIFPTWFIEYNQDLYDVYGKFDIWKENVGNYGEFYGQYRDGEIEYLLNPKGSAVCLFNNYEYAMEAYSGEGENVLDETWDSVRIYDDYQWSASRGTGCVILAPDEIGTTDGSEHGLVNGDRVMISGSVLPGTIDNSTMYYVIEPTLHRFKISESMNGTPLIFAFDTTGMFHYIDVPLSISGTLTNDKRRMRTWRIKDLRDMKGYVDGSLKPRIRDTYARLLFKYMHADNKKIIMHDLNTFYTITRESYSKF